MLRFAADLKIELIFLRVERILEINELHTVITEVVEEARAMLVLGQA